MRKELTKTVRPYIIEGWNANNEIEAYDCKVSFATFPQDFDGSNYPRIRFDIILMNGQTQDNFHCAKPFVDMIQCISNQLYNKIGGLDPEA